MVSWTRVVAVKNYLILDIFWKENQHYCCYLVVESCPTLATPCTIAGQAPLSSTISWSLLRFMSTESVMLSNHLIFCCALLLPSIFLSIRIFSNELALCIRWPKYWSFRAQPLVARQGQFCHCFFHISAWLSWIFFLLPSCNEVKSSIGQTSWKKSAF